MTISVRIKSLKGEMSIPQFCALIGEEKPQRLQDVLAGRQRLPEDMLIKILKCTGCDANWLLLGEGSSPEITPKEKALLDSYRNAGKDGQRALERMALLEAQQVKPIVDDSRIRRNG
jgi:hypothetical protein